MNNLRTYIFPGLALGLLLTLGMIMFACSPTPKTKPIITVSIQPQKYLLEKIVGDKIDIMCLLSQGSNQMRMDPICRIL